jgi:hypothetical protein
MAAFATATLVGCAGSAKVKPFYIEGMPNPFVKSVTCTAQDCDLTVTVVENADGTCIPDVAPILNIKTGPAGDRNVTWTLANDDYEFSKENFKFGIFIKSDPREEFKNAQVTGGGKALTLVFRHKHTGIDYSYGLTVRRKVDKSFCETLDPWMIS